MRGPECSPDAGPPPGTAAARPAAARLSVPRVPTVLLVEDNPRLAARMTYLVEAGRPRVRVLTVGSGAAALDVAGRQAFDALVMDYDLPDMTGFVCLAAVRRVLPYVPAVLVTGVGDEQLAVEALREHHVLNYVSKRRPDWAKQLAASVRDAIFRMTFRREGDHWRIGPASCEAIFTSLDGFGIIRTLLSQPGRDLDVDLVFGAAAPAGDGAGPDTGADAGLHVTRDLGRTEASLDARARAAYRTRLRELAAERRRAEETADDAAERLVAEETRRLVEELRRNRFGRHRSTHRETMRVGSRRSVDRAVERLRPALPALAGHLAARIHVGSLCRYVPDPDWPVEWDL